VSAKTPDHPPSFTLLVFRKKKQKILLPATAPRGHAEPRDRRQLHGVGTQRRIRTWWVVPVREGEDERIGNFLDSKFPSACCTKIVQRPGFLADGLSFGLSVLNKLACSLIFTSHFTPGKHKNQSCSSLR
jgi:hypothetical protein